LPSGPLRQYCFQFRILRPQLQVVADVGRIESFLQLTGAGSSRLGRLRRLELS
jgi:hypothetical protein